MKSKKKGNVNCIKLTLIAVIGAMTISTAVLAAEKSENISTPENNNGGNVVPLPETATQKGTTHKGKRLPYFAKIGNAKLGNIYINWIEYENEFTTEARKKFYHGKPGEAAVADFQRQIGKTLITNAMLVLEAKRRKLQPDNDVVQQQVDQFDQRLAKDPNWPKSRQRVLAIMKTRYENDSLRNKLEELVRNVPTPTEKQLHKYYDTHPEKFTSPAQERISTILLRVDPGAPDADWQKAIEQGQFLVKRIRDGEDFAALARQYSGDVTAEDGGDMGYMHEGMLPGLPAETVSKLKPGETSEPVTLMEGVGIFRLVDRKKPGVSSFADVKERATELWMTEKRDSDWNALIAKLKKNTPVIKDESRFLPISTEKPPKETSTEKSKP